MLVCEGRDKPFCGHCPTKTWNFCGNRWARGDAPHRGAGRANGRQNTTVRSDIEENRLVFALNTNVEAVDRQLASHLFVGNESRAPVSRHERQDGITVVSRLFGEVEPGIDL